MTRVREPVDLLVVTSTGGHLAEALEWLPALEGLSWRLVLNAEGEVPPSVAARTLRMSHAERDWRVAWNFVEAWRILQRHPPRAIASPGAGCALPFAVLGRLLGIPVVQVEPRSCVRRPTLTGRLVRPFAARVLVQWPALKEAYPRAACHEAFPASSS